MSGLDLAVDPLFLFAVTGSVNQNGQVQAIGGVNEKIEGFYDLCEARGLTGRQGVLIPASNVKHLMLHHRVVEACARRRFAIHAVSTIDEGIEILTGIKAGTRDEDGKFPDGTIGARVERSSPLSPNRARLSPPTANRANRDHGRKRQQNRPHSRRARQRHS